MYVHVCTYVTVAVLQVSYGASTPTLSERTMFPRFFRTIPSEVQANSARFALMERFKWERVATLHETRNIFSVVQLVCTCIHNVCTCIYILGCTIIALHNIWWECVFVRVVFAAHSTVEPLFSRHQ